MTVRLSATYRFYAFRRAAACAAAVALCAHILSAQSTYTVHDATGAEFELSAPPKVAVLTPNIAITIAHLGARENIAAVSRYCLDYPEVDKNTPNIGGFIDPNYERILAVKPDLVLLPNTKNATVRNRLEKLGVKCFMTNGEGAQNIAKDVRLLGRLLKKEDTADSLAKRVENALRRDSPRGARAFFMFGKLAAGKGSFMGDILESCGVQNCADAAGKQWFEPLPEFIMRANPDVVFAEIKDGQAPEDVAEEFKKSPAWRSTKAVQNGNVILVPSKLAIIPSVNVANAAAFMRQKLDALGFGTKE